MEKDTTVYRVRKFLNNDADMPGLILAKAEVTRYGHTNKKSGKINKGGYTSISLTLGDCVRTVSLSFSADTKSKLRDSLAKIDRMREVLEQLREAIVDSHILITEWKDGKETLTIGG